MTLNPLRARINNHRSAIHTGKTNAVANHYRNHDVNNMQVAILECPPNASNRQLQVKEAIWINLLNTLSEGLNIKDETLITLNPHTLHTMEHFQHWLTCTPYLTSVNEELKQNKL